MSTSLVKICGFRDAEIAKRAVLVGADFIGLNFHPESKRYVTIEKANEITKAVKEVGGIPVGVFVNQTAEEIKHICQTLELSYIQLHGDIPRMQHQYLSPDLHRIYVCPVVEGKISCVADALSTCNQERDFILFDTQTPGSGKKFNWQDFHYDQTFKWFIAGGLTAENVKNALKLLRPTAVDVSSGVESAPGIKSIELISKFIQAVKGEGNGA